MSHFKIAGFHDLESNKIIKEKWYNLYGPKRNNSFFKKLEYQFNIGSHLEEYFYFGRIFVSGELKEYTNKKNNHHEVDTFRTKSNVQHDQFSNKNFERTILHHFWIDVHELKMFDDANNNYDIEIEVQILHKIKYREAQYNKSKQKYIWKNLERRFDRIQLELSEKTNQLPLVFIRIKKVGNYLTQDSYLGYFTFDIGSKLYLKNNREVKPERINIRKCETTVKDFEDKSNLLGEMLITFNCFTTKEGANLNEIKRIRLPDQKLNKKFKLYSKIYLGKYFPIKDEKNINVVSCRVDFYSENDETVKHELGANPRFGDLLSLDAMLNEEVEYSENIKLSARCGNKNDENLEEIIGMCEISVKDVKTYSSERGLEKDLFNRATWFPLKNSKDEIVCFVLARFMLIQTSNEVSFDGFYLDPIREKKKTYHILIFLIGIRNIQVEENESFKGGSISLNYFDFLDKDRKKNKYKKLGKCDNEFKNNGYSASNYNFLKVKNNLLNFRIIKMKKEIITLLRFRQ